MRKKYNIALVGNPNCGKTTLFNKLTGARQQIGNWPGVTVEKKQGSFTHHKHKIDVYDLPGCYSLVTTQEMGDDERVSCDFLLSHSLNESDTIIVNVIDSCHINRDLYLTRQLQEAGLPVIVALNFIDKSQERGYKIMQDQMANMLGCPVVPLVASKGKGLNELKQEIVNFERHKQKTPKLEAAGELQEIIDTWKKYLPVGLCYRALEGDVALQEHLTKFGIDSNKVLNNISEKICGPLDLIIAAKRREIIAAVIGECVSTPTHKVQSKQDVIKRKIDDILLHPVLGLFSFLAIVYLTFGVAVSFGSFLQSYLEEFANTALIDMPLAYLQTINCPEFIINILVNGIGLGLAITITFVPVLAMMFLLLGVMESTGYMARAAFIIDKLMCVFGLPGKSFVPIIIGFGCNVPAVLGTRTLSSRKERILTIMMTPFMSCSARLAVYAIFVANFFPTTGHNVIFLLYITGILIAMLTGITLKSTVLKPSRVSSILELPDYNLPNIKALTRQVFYRIKRFVAKASTLIIPLCIIFNGIGNSNLEAIGKRITPIFSPIGISQENWPATVGLLTGLVAKETVIGSLNALYSDQENTTVDAESNMVALFGSKHAAFAYLLFTLLYFPCASVVATMARELNKRWAAFSVVWSTTLAYLIAAIYYQVATLNLTSSTSILWAFGSILTLGAMLLTARFIAACDPMLKEKRLVPTHISIQ